MNQKHFAQRSNHFPKKLLGLHRHHRNSNRRKVKRHYRNCTQNLHQPMIPNDVMLVLSFMTLSHTAMVRPSNEIIIVMMTIIIPNKNPKYSFDLSKKVHPSALVLAHNQSICDEYHQTWIHHLWQRGSLSSDNHRSEKDLQR